MTDEEIKAWRRDFREMRHATPWSEDIEHFLQCCLAAALWCAGAWWLFEPAWPWLLFWFGFGVSSLFWCDLDTFEEQVREYRAKRAKNIRQPPSA